MRLADAADPVLFQILLAAREIADSLAGIPSQGVDRKIPPGTVLLQRIDKLDLPGITVLQIVRFTAVDGDFHRDPMHLLVVMSMSLTGRPSRRSRTQPPTHQACAPCRCSSSRHSNPACFSF